MVGVLLTIGVLVLVHGSNDWLITGDPDTVSVGRVIRDCPDRRDKVCKVGNKALETLWQPAGDCQLGSCGCLDALWL